MDFLTDCIETIQYDDERNQENISIETRVEQTKINDVVAMDDNSVVRSEGYASDGNGITPYITTKNNNVLAKGASEVASLSKQTGMDCGYPCDWERKAGQAYVDGNTSTVFWGQDWTDIWYLQEGMWLNDMEFIIRVMDITAYDGRMGLLSSGVGLHRAVGLGGPRSRGISVSIGIGKVNGKETVELMMLVGQGLEGVLNDGKIGRIMDKHLPKFQQEGYVNRGLNNYLYNVLLDMCSEAGVGPKNSCSQKENRNKTAGVGGGTTAGGGAFRSYQVNEWGTKDPQPPIDPEEPNLPGGSYMDYTSQLDTIIELLKSIVGMQASIIKEQWNTANHLYSGLMTVQEAILNVYSWNQGFVVSFFGGYLDGYSDSLSGISNGIKDMKNAIVAKLGLLEKLDLIEKHLKSLVAAEEKKKDFFDDVILGFGSVGDKLDEIIKLLESIYDWLDDFKVKSDGSIWSMLASMFEDVTELFMFIVEKLIYLIVPENTEFITRSFDSLVKSVNSKMEPVNLLKSEIQNVFSVSNHEMENVYVDLPVYGRVMLFDTKYLNGNIQTIRNFISAILILITAIWAYRKITSEMIK